MARRMLIDASHPEETRVVVVDGTKLTEFDFETASRRPLKGNIFLAKVIRIEPSLQAAFVEYGGNRHGFLAFSEIHPDYFQIPVADRERLLAEQRAQAEEADERPERTTYEREQPDDQPEQPDADAQDEAAAAEPVTEVAEAAPAEPSAPVDPIGESESPVQEAQAQPAAIPVESLAGPAEPTVIESASEAPTAEPATAEAESAPATESSEPSAASEAVEPVAEPLETLGGEDIAGEEREKRERRRRQPTRQYKIQEVIKRRQILLVQVVKEERGNKGAALTTYLSLAGRYCVLMPNAGRGGGISRKISNPNDRKRMKEILAELEVPQGMGVILRTAGLERSNLDIKRDYEYLIRLWNSIRELTMRSTAPALIYEEGDLVKRSLRDVFDTDIAQVLVEGEAGYQVASEFMRQLIPHQAEKVQLYKEPIPLFHRYQVESQFDAMHHPTVQLRSGGYIVINPTEALVAIDVNSGRSTKERNIEETALRTNIEAAEEVARQVRLRDLAGLIVIDFIDMEEHRHQRQVEHKVKDAMRNDRARIQIGRISAFGLMEMSRQRLRPSLLEHSTEICPHCAGTGRVRSIESAALHALRAIEEEGVRRRSSEIVVSVPPNVALYLLNQKRHALSEIEQRYAFHVTIEADDELHAADCEIERVRQRRDDRAPQELARATYDAVEGEPAPEAEAEDGEGEADGERERAAGDEDGDRDGRGRRRRRRRRRGRRDGEDRGEERSAEGEDRPYAAAENGHDAPPADEPPESDSEPMGNNEGEGAPAEARGEGDVDGEQGDRRRRRGRRGGRRRRGREDGDGEPAERNGNGWDRAEEGQAAPDAPLDRHPAAPLDGQPVEQPPFQPHAAMNTEAASPPPPPSIAPPPEPVVARAPQPVPEPIQAQPEPPPPPAVVIPTISADAPPEKPKRGWWRR
ncbi:MAG: Rne/Rng family ribonuclease [Reyranella sp.]|uniref:Rne/Rng family ribonuclease n=1 Tax=Reyranella sp. TaxID=1929291 RepID=UPI001ACAF8EE|nr:ribonuclease E/G [Reyranella sp.]MBN9088773.1 Rne/Rng family ribonuclease [Reyranella sp.]